ncbi:MAG: hypothetical protein EON56_02265 [Alphaproteobacteria bacterium]|nr:MAG: hypothetical protein EON56_02265 [Alphaproteobacteria bacterium]
MSHLAVEMRDVIDGRSAKQPRPLLQWLTAPAAMADEAMRAEFIKTLSGHRSKAAFGVECVIFLMGCFALTYNAFTGLAVIVATAPIGGWRLAVLGRNEHDDGGRRLVVSGLCWAALVGITGGLSAHSGQTLLTTLAGLIMTGLAFGGAFSNAGLRGWQRPRFF